MARRNATRQAKGLRPASRGYVIPDQAECDSFARGFADLIEKALGGPTSGREEFEARIKRIYFEQCALGHVRRIGRARGKP